MYGGMSVSKFLNMEERSQRYRHSGEAGDFGADGTGEPETGCKGLGTAAVLHVRTEYQDTP